MFPVWGNLMRHMALHDPDSSVQEKSLALKYGRQKKIQIIDGHQVQTSQLLLILFWFILGWILFCRVEDLEPRGFEFFLRFV